MNNKIIAVDFDGTLCENKWPEIGEPNTHLIRYLQTEQQTGSKLILWTCRVGALLDEAVAWCKENGLIFDAVNENLPERIEAFGGDCRKISADIYIDDRNSKLLFKLPFVKEIKCKHEYEFCDLKLCAKYDPIRFCAGHEKCPCYEIRK